MKFFEFGCVGSLILIACSGCTGRPPLNPKSLDVPAAAFAKEAIEATGHNWTYDFNVEHLDAPPTPAEVLKTNAPLLQLYSSKLGTVKKVGEVKREDANLDSLVTGQVDYVAAYKSEVECRNATATITVTIKHKENRWYVVSMSVNSPALKETNKDEDLASKAFVEQIESGLASKLSIDYLKANADSIFGAELSKNNEVKDMMDNAKKTLGSFKSCDAVQDGTWSMNAGVPLYAYTFNALYEHGKGAISIQTGKENGSYKLRSFKIDAHS